MFRAGRSTLRTISGLRSFCSPAPRPRFVTKPIMASGKHDVGLKDHFNHKELLEKHGDEPMPNLKVVPNDGQVTSDDPDHPASKHLMQIGCSWNLADQKRNYVLLVEDLEKEYTDFVDYCVPNAKKLLDEFREKELPVVWTNWARRSDDGMYGAIDRFYGPRGVKDEKNPAYVYGADAADTVDELAPQTEDEQSRYIVSLHLSKFGDLDEHGNPILLPMFQAWGVNTVILIGAWTDDCIAATAFDAVDLYGLDVVLVTDAVATATTKGEMMKECLCAAVCKGLTADQVVAHLRGNPNLIEEPKAELRGEVRHLHPPPYTSNPAATQVAQQKPDDNDAPKFFPKSPKFF